MPKDVTHGRGYVYSLQYHIVWVTKYRKPIFIGEIEEDVRSYLLETLKSLDMTVLAMEIMPDHIQLLVDCKPQLRLSDAIKILKGNTARWLFSNILKSNNRFGVDIYGIHRILLLR